MSASPRWPALPVTRTFTRSVCAADRKRTNDSREVALPVLDRHGQRSMREIGNRLRQPELAHALRCGLETWGQILAGRRAVDGKVRRDVEAVEIDAAVEVVHPDEEARQRRIGSC